MISEFPLLVFTTCAGLSAGLYAVSAVFPVGKSAKRKWILPVVCLVLLGVGLLGCLFHLQKPQMFLFALANPMAGIAQEAYLSIALGVVLLVDLILTWRKGSAPSVLRYLGAVVSIALMLVMANAYTASMSVAAWVSLATFPLFLFGDLGMGFALAGALDYAMKSDGQSEPEGGECAGLTCQKGFSTAEIVFFALAAAAFAAEGVQFASAGLVVIPFVVSVVLALAGIVPVFAVKAGKVSEGAGAWVAFACLFVATVIARYAFYAACVL